MPELSFDRDGEDLRILADDRELVRYAVSGDAIPARDTPKPYLHPLRTLGGVLITDFAPEDHPWHHGLAFAFPRVGEHNLWGGGTYFGPERGYIVVEDQGSIRHDAWDQVDPAAGRFAHRLTWLGHSGERLIEERRGYTLRLVEAGETRGWMLELDTVLDNVTDADLPLETPAQRGRDDGGYGGWFLRCAEGFQAVELSSDGVPVESSGATGDTFVIAGRTASGEDVTIGMAYGPGDSPGTRSWLYRFEPFPLAGFAVAYHDGLTIPQGGSLSFSHRIVCFDGVVAQGAVREALST